MSLIDDIIRNLPPGLTEADVIDMIDGGGAVPQQREGAIIEALRADPRLALLVKQLRADRAMLIAAEPAIERAPASLVDLIDAQLERAALSALVHEAEEATAPIPISSVQPARGFGGGRGVLAVLAESIWARRLATAASIAVVGGLGALGVRELVRQWPRISGASPIASNDARPNDVGVTADPGETRLTHTDPDAASMHASEIASNTTSVSPPPARDSAAGHGDAMPTELSPAAALALAQEGRLVITVRARQLPATLRHLESLSRSAGAESRWRAYPMTNLPAELAMLASPLPGGVPGGATDFPGPTGGGGLPPGALASDAIGPRMPAGDAALPPPTAGPTLTPARVVVKSVSVVRMSAESHRLADLLSDLNAAREQRAEFRVLPPGSALEQRPALDPDAVLWWSAGPESWAPRVSIPIVVEVLE